TANDEYLRAYHSQPELLKGAILTAVHCRPISAWRVPMSEKAKAAVEIFSKHVGTSDGFSEWIEVDQKRINLFADATLDHQFIHIDPERSAKLSPYKVTI